MSMPWQDLTIEEKVKNVLIYEAASGGSSEYKAQLSAAYAAGLQAAFKRKAKEAALKKAYEALRELTKAYEKQRTDAVQVIGTNKFNAWQKWQIEEKKLDDAKAPAEQYESTEKQINDERDMKNESVMFAMEQVFGGHKEACTAIWPKYGIKLKWAKEKSLIEKLSDIVFKQLRKKALLMAAKLAKKMTVSLNTQFDTDKINRKLAEIPLKIEEKIDEIKKKLDELLGKLVAEIATPSSPKFDPKSIMDELKKTINPVMSSTAPLKKIVGNIPVLGDLLPMADMMMQSGGGQLTKEEIEKLVPKKPEIDPTLMDKVKAITNDAILFVMTLPMIVIDVILQMIYTIYEKLKVIAKTIPLGNLFPLSLIDSAIQATPHIKKMVKTFPSQFEDLIKGQIKSKLAEAMALSVPKPQVDPTAMVAIAQKAVAAKKLAESENPPRLDYKDYSDQFFVSTLSAYGYMRSQLDTVEDGYKKVFIGTDKSKPKIKMYKDNGIKQEIPPVDGSLADAATLGTSTSALVKGYNWDDLERSPQSPEDYNCFLQKMASQAGPDISAYFPYYRLAETEKVVGEMYKTYETYFKTQPPEMVLVDSIKPNQRLSWSNFWKPKSMW